jgi:hypothetical protein
MLRLREFSAWISTNGIPLLVFQPVVDANNSRVTSWIACDKGEASTPRVPNPLIANPALADVQSTLEGRGK